MKFIKEGKLMSYLEVVEWLNTLDKNNVIDVLEEKEVMSLYQRIFRWQLGVLEGYMEKAGGSIGSKEQLFQRMYEQRLIDSTHVWERAVAINKLISENNVLEKKEVVEFIRGAYLPALTELEPCITKWENRVKDHLSYR